MRTTILDYSTKVETLLKKLGATGKGVHEKLNSIQFKISPPMVKKIRRIATIRNKAVHEADFSTDLDKFIVDSSQVTDYLNNLLIEERKNEIKTETKIKTETEIDQKKDWSERSGGEKAVSVGFIALIASIVFLFRR
jgi:hypothetical protein